MELMIIAYNGAHHHLSESIFAPEPSLINQAHFFHFLETFKWDVALHHRYHGIPI